VTVRTCDRLNCITPPHILNKLLESDDAEIRAAAMNTLLATARLRGERSVRATLASAAVPVSGRRTVLDCRNSVILSDAVVVRNEDDPPSGDKSVNQAFDGFGWTRKFYLDVHKRNSIDDQGMRLQGFVHRGRKYNNAFWDGQEMVFGDGDGKVFTDFTGSLDVIAHELAHGVTEHTAALEYHNQSGALNEHCSDVVGSLVKQWSLQQTVEQADWLIGSEVFTPGVGGDALRSMKAPGEAYDNDLLGKDPQPADMAHYVQLPDTEDGDWGGVHINSGIPNKAFYLVAKGIGGHAWEAPGHIWYETLKASNPSTNFQQFADTTYVKAHELFGAGSAEKQAVLAGWQGVGIKISSKLVEDGGNTLEALGKRLDALTDQVAALAAEVRGSKG
jgi:Zn-dependent metalloprotease